MTAAKNNLTLRPNEYAKILYDLVWSTALMLNQSCNQNTSCTNYHQQYEYNIMTRYNRVFEIIHIKNLSQIFIGTVYFNSSTTVFVLNESYLDTALMDELPVANVDLPTGYTIMTALLISLTTIYVTSMLLLYIYFHKEPEIKATSFTLSLLIFAGCYFNLFYLSILNYFDHYASNSLSTSHQTALCNLRQWFSAQGMSLPLMLAVVLVKMLRIYHIFKKFKLRLGHYCSDLSLAGYVILILTPNITVNLIWSVSDNYHISLQYEALNGYILVEKDCISKYKTVWIGVLCLYLLVLSLVLTIVAIKTRKVRLQNFKDTKKVNILLFIICLVTTLTYAYWFLLQILNSKSYVVSIVLHAGHLLVVLSFQSLLFVPKVFPPFWRKVVYYRSLTD